MCHQQVPPQKPQEAQGLLKPVETHTLVPNQLLFIRIISSCLPILRWGLGKQQCICLPWLAFGGMHKTPKSQWQFFQWGAETPFSCFCKSWEKQSAMLSSRSLQSDPSSCNLTHWSVHLQHGQNSSAQLAWQVSFSPTSDLLLPEPPCVGCKGTVWLHPFHLSTVRVRNDAHQCHSRFDAECSWERAQKGSRPSPERCSAKQDRIRIVCLCMNEKKRWMSPKCNAMSRRMKKEWQATLQPNPFGPTDSAFTLATPTSMAAKPCGCLNNGLACGSLSLSLSLSLSHSN